MPLHQRIVGTVYNKDIAGNDLQTIITQAIEDMKHEMNGAFDPASVNLAELERRTGISRGKLRGLQKNGFHVKAHGNAGKKAATHIMDGFTGVLDNLLRNSVTNSVVCFERLQESGFTGSLSTVKNYIKDHSALIPPKRQAVAPQGNRGRRYSTDPGESYQMDWGFITTDDGRGNESRRACFAMICHHCGYFYIEFFPDIGAADGYKYITIRLTHKCL